ncbi:hypothetical protein V8C35DRAFT_64115 [Trichoderma chlorosporum]
MGFFDEIAKGLAHAQEEAARHITPENINRGLQIARDSIGHAAEQIHEVSAPDSFVILDLGINFTQHVTPENINHGIQFARAGMNVAAQQINQHVTKENVDRAAEEMRKMASGPAAQQVVDAVSENHVPIAVTGVGILIAAVPGIITAPIMGIAGLMGFTSGGIAAASIASGAQAGMGSVAAGSAFSVMQSAAAGGYGVGIVTGIVQAAGGVTAAAGSIAGGILAWMRASAT